MWINSRPFVFSPNVHHGAAQPQKVSAASLLVTVAGTVKALDVGAPALVAIAMGAVTGSVGGIIRDTLGHVPSVLLRHEIYVTASVLELICDWTLKGAAL